MSHKLSYPDAPAVIELLESRIAPAFSSPIDLSTFTGANGTVIAGETAFDESGRSVSDAGDVNGDGYPDLVIGAPKSSAGGAAQGGSAYVVFGQPGGLGGTFDLDALDGSNGFRLTYPAAGERMGWSVDGAGDVNDDGYDDVIVGMRGTDTATGRAFVVFGKGSPFAASIDVTGLNGSNGFMMTGVYAGSDTGYAVAGIGDFNDDGYDDIAVGAPGHGAGNAYVVFGKAAGWAANLNLSTLNGTNGFRMDGQADSDNFGIAVAGAGDFNRDGIPDLLIGANAADSGAVQNVGATYVIFGTRSSFSATFNVGGLIGSNGFKVIGGAEFEDIGNSLDIIGDINGDGFDDISIGAYRSEPHGAWSGATYVVYGTAATLAPSFSVSSLDGTSGFKISGEGFSDFVGWEVRRAGDLNGDGFKDLVIGAPRYGTFDKELCGAAYVVFGKSGNFPSTLELSTIDGSNGVKVIGAHEDDYAGVSVSGMGDVNGDGFDDILVSAYQADPYARSKAGQTYVIYGKQTIMAEVSGSGSSASFEGADGMIVTVSVSKGSLTADKLILRGLPDGGAELLRLDLTDSMFQGANVKITSAPPAPTLAKTHHAAALMNGVPEVGTGYVNVGFLNADGVDLGKVTVDGNISRIVAGDSEVSTPAFKSLKVNSLSTMDGRLLTADDEGPSTITGAVKTLKVASDIWEFDLTVDSIETLTVAGSLEHIDIHAESLGTVKIGGSVTECLFELSGITDPANAKASSVLKSMTIDGSLIRAVILGGVDYGGTPLNPDVSMGTIQVNGNWVASELVVGVTSGANGQYGDDDDLLIPGGSSEIIAKVAKLIIKGDAVGTYEEGDQFGIIAEQFGSAMFGKTKLPLSKTSADAFVIGETKDLLFREAT